MTFLDLGQIEEKALAEGCKVQFVHSSNMTLAYWNLEPGASLPQHSHPHEQVASILEGQFELTVDGETRLLGPGSVAIVPSNAPHSGRAVTDCRIIDVFYPVREDYR